jgi:FtsP/CotA-like multicopper oxidase with cupredoxin domain
MNAKAESEALHPAENPKRKRLDKKGILLLIAIFLLVLVLTLGLGLGLGLKKKNSETLTNTKPPQSWRRDPQDYVLSNSFDTKAPSTTRTYTLNLTEIPNGAPDGVSRRLLLINGQFPGPVIEVNEGDQLVVHVNNFMTLPSAIHWHGQYQNGIPSSFWPKW